MRAGRQHLQRNRAVEPLVFGLVDHAHPALADSLEDAKVREVPADQRRDRATPVDGVPDPERDCTSDPHKLGGA
mgnify:CR=1 FL=1